MKPVIFHTFIVALAIIAAGCTRKDEPQLYDRIKSTDKIVFATMAISKTAKFESDKWYTIGKRIAVYSYDTYLQAYIDMTLLQADDIEIDHSRHTMRITLPAIETQLTGRDMTLRKEYENIGPLRSDLDARERAMMKEQANESLLKELDSNTIFRQQLIKDAQQKARMYFQALAQKNGYTAEINFR